MSIPKTQHQNMQGGGGGVGAESKWRRLRKTVASKEDKNLCSERERESIIWRRIGCLVVRAVGCGDSGHYKGGRIRDTDVRMTVFFCEWKHGADTLQWFMKQKCPPVGLNLTFLFSFGWISPCIVRGLRLQKWLCCQDANIPCCVRDCACLCVWPHGKVLLVWME